MTARRGRLTSDPIRAGEAILAVPDLSRLPAIGDLLSVLADSNDPAVLANAYVAGRRLKLTLDRALREPGRQLQAELVRMQRDADPAGAARHRTFRAGPIRLSWRAIDPKWVANEPENWTNREVQAALEELAKTPGFSQFVAYLPGHWEVLTQAVGLGMTEGDPAARLMFDQAVEKHWRTEQGRAAVVEVGE